jgi:tetratricopeptide (TPR) repeat protein
MTFSGNRAKPSSQPVPAGIAGGSRKGILLQAGLILLLVIVAYLPAIRGGFIWDDDAYVTENPTLRTAGGLARIWFKLGAVPQYYPMVHTMFWIEHQLWGLHPLGYHVVNVLLHALGAILLWMVLRRLAVPGAWLGAAIFAVHPVQVESVAWITERKNVLSGVFYLSSLLSLLAFFRIGAAADRDAGSREKFYVLGLLFYILALLSKSVTCTLPVILLLLLWWKRGRVRWGEVLRLAPLFLAGIALGFVTVWVEKNFVGAEGEEWALSFLDRLVIAGRALWFYAGKLLWPHPLIFNYPRWEIDSGSWAQYLPLAAAAAVVAALWAWRSRIGKGPLVAVLFFAVTLAPALGFFDVYPMRYSFVADHFQYLASLGLIALFAGAAAAFSRRWLPLPPRTVGAALLLLVLGVLTWRQGREYRNVETLWRATIAKNPSSWMAHHNLGNELIEQGRLDEAVEQFRAALREKPDHYKAHASLGSALSQQGKFAEAEREYAEALRLHPNYANAYYDLGLLQQKQGDLEAAAKSFEAALRIRPNHALAHYALGVVLRRQKRDADAIEQLSDALAITPDYAPAHLSLGLIFHEQGKMEEAVRQYREALRCDPGLANAHHALGVALISQNQVPEARKEFEKALQIDPTLQEARRNLELIDRYLREHPAGSGGSGKTDPP